MSFLRHNAEVSGGTNNERRGIVKDHQTANDSPSASPICSSACWFCQKPGEIVCQSLDCQRQHAEIIADEYRTYRQEVHEAVAVAIKERCKNDNNWCLTRWQRWFYTLKLLVCVLIRRGRPRGLPSYPDVVEVGHHHFARTYAGWTASWIVVGYGIVRGWWYEIERDSDWDM